MQRFGKKLWVFLLHGRLSRQVGHHEDFELLGVLEGWFFCVNVVRWESRVYYVEALPCVQVSAGGAKPVRTSPMSTADAVLCRC